MYLLFSFDLHLVNIKSLTVGDLYAVAFQIACLSSVWGRPSFCISNF